MSDFAILGRVLARQGDRLLPLAEPKTRAVLAALLINPNHVVSANRLIALVWGPNPPMSALNTLQVQISKLRRCLGESARERYALETRPPGYMIRIASDSIDAGQFLALSESARSAVKAGDHGAALDSLDSALALWRGAALEDVDLPFAAAERERLEGLRLDVLEDRFEALTSVGREGEALEALERTAAMHPLRERLQGQLMIALYRCGRQAEASAVYQRTRERLVEEMGMEPGPQLQGILRGILKQEVSVLTPAVTSAKRSNLPIARTRFVGRASQVLEIAQMVRDGPLLTLLGAGGIGKTRLGMRVAEELEPEFGDGACWVDLAPLVDETVVTQKVMAAVGIHEGDQTPPLERLVEGLQDRRLLLVLDNCEHLLDSCAQVVDAILSSCPEVKIMITSRETLDIDGERVWLVPPLTAPAGADLAAVGGLDAFESVELFLDRAQAVRSGRELSDSEVSAIARACGRLDGIPLALELAAGQMLAMSAQEILDRLDSRFALLEAGSRSRLPRHQTMRRAVDWSHNLLSDQEKVLFRRLSVFAGGFDLQAVGPVCGWDPLMADEVSGLIGNLVRKSLVLVDEGPAGRSRYRLLETLRQYAAEKLDAAAEADPTRRLHAITYSALAEPLEQVRRTPQGPGFLQYLAAEYDNACAALEWSDAHDGELFLDLTANWARYWSDRGLMSEGRRWLEKGLVRPGGPVQRRGLMIMMLAQILYRMDAAEISEVVETGLSLLEGTDDRYLQAGLINLAGMAYVQAGRWEDAKARFIEATKLGDGEPLFGPALANLGECDWVLGDATTGRSRINRAITMYRDGGLSHLIAPGLILLGHLERVEGRVPAAQEALMEALELCQNMGDQHYLAEAFRALAFAAAADLQPEASLRLRGLARSINRHVGAVDGTWAFGQQGEQLVEDMRATVGEARAAELAKEGAAMSVEDAIEYARCLTQAYSSGDEATERSSY